MSYDFDLNSKTVEFVVADYPTFTHRTVTITATDFTTSHADLVEALVTYPWLTTAPDTIPEALYTALLELARGYGLAPAAISAVRVLLELEPWPVTDATDYCPSCFSLVRDGNEWDDDEEDEATLGYRWTAGTGAGGTATCAQCLQSSGAMGGIQQLGGGRMSGLPRYMVHPSQWDQAGFRPDVTA